MKRTLIFAAAVAMLAGCAKDPGTDNPKSGNPEGTITFRAAASQYSTRVEITDGDAGLSFEWLANEDKIGLFATDVNGKLKDNAQYKAVSSGSVSDFSPVSADQSIVWGRMGHDFYAYHPYSAEAGTDINNIPVSLPAAQIQNGENLAHIAPLNFIYAKKENVTQAVGTVDLSFNHIYSVLNIQLTATEGTATVKALKFRGDAGDEKLAFDKATFDFETGAYAIADDATVNNEIVLTFAEPITVRSTRAYNAYMLIAPGHAGKTFRVFAVDADDAEVEINLVKVPASGSGIPSGVKPVIKCNVVGTVAGATNLSAGGTANTYLINAEGNYKFDATLKGNGVPREYVMGSKKLSYDMASITMMPKKALVLWYNCEQTSTAWKDESPVVVSSVELKDDGYIYFSTPEDGFVNGNVVIVALDADKDYDTIEATGGVINNANILWSWNIWASEGYNPETDTNNISAGDYTVMGRNLGAIADKVTYGAANHEKAAGMVGNYYQWGRKDPFPAFPSYSHPQGRPDGLWFTPTYTPITALQNDGVGTALLDNQIFVSSNTANTLDYISTFNESIAQAVQNPHKFIKDAAAGSGNQWVSVADGMFRALWGVPNTADSNVPLYETGLKSIYDPCPAGWQLWDNSAFKAVTELGAVGTDYGLSVNGGGYFPIAAGRLINSESIGSLPQNTGNTAGFDICFHQANCNVQAVNFSFGYIWTTKWVEGVMTVDSFTNENKSYPYNGSKARSVRCVKDTEEIVVEPEEIVIGGDSGEEAPDQISKMTNWSSWDI